jgi:hypothetical protein
MDDDSADIAIFRGNRVKADPVLDAEAKTAVAMLRSFQKGDLKASEVFDVEKLGTFFAVTDLWAGSHATVWHNIRFYYNPITARLEPVGYDANPLTYYSVDVATSLMQFRICSKMLKFKKPMFALWNASLIHNIWLIYGRAWNWTFWFTRKPYPKNILLVWMHRGKD